MAMRLPEAERGDHGVCAIAWKCESLIELVQYPVLGRRRFRAEAQS